MSLRSESHAGRSNRFGDEGQVRREQVDMLIATIFLASGAVEMLPPRQAGNKKTDYPDG